MSDNGTSINSNHYSFTSNLPDLEKDIQKVTNEIDKMNSALQSTAVQVDALIQHFKNLANNTQSVNVFNAAKILNGVNPNGHAMAGGVDGFTVDPTGNSAELKRLEKEIYLAKQRESKAALKAAKAAEKRANFLNSEANIKDIESRTKARDELSNFRKFKNKHPERFTTTGERKNWSNRAAAALNAVGGKAESLGVGGRVVGGVMQTVGGFLLSPATGVMTAVTKLGEAIIDLGKASVQAYSDIEATKVQLGVVFSSQTKANSVFEDISQYAVKSPFGIQQTSELAVLLKQSGVYASDLMSTVRMLGDTAGGNMEKMKRIANNYAQIMAIGKASMLDMRQFAYAGIPIFEAVSKELKVSQIELRKMISDGKVTSDVIEKVFKNLTGVNGVFENATEQGAKTLKARLQNLSDSKQLALASIGEWGVNLGRKTGNDSYAISLLNWTEKVYQELHDNVNTKNIEKDVETIANRNNKIEELQRLIAYNEAIGNKDYVKELKAILQVELSKIDIEAERATYEKSYENKTKKADRARVLLNELGYNQNDGPYIQKELDTINLTKIFNTLDNLLVPFYYPLYGINYDRYGVAEYRKTKLRELIPLLPYLSEEKQVNEQEEQAHYETTMTKAQDAVADLANKNADAAASLTAVFQEIDSIYKNSKEYKDKLEEEKIKILKEGLQEISALKEIADKEDNIDITKLTPEKFLNLIDRGGLTTSGKYKVINGQKVNDDKDSLLKNLQWAFEGAYDKLSQTDVPELQLANKEAIKSALKSTWLKIENSKDQEDFYTKLPAFVQKIEKDLSDSTRGTSLTGLASFILNLINGSTMPYTAAGLHSNVTEDMLSNGNGNGSDIGLWKRILGSATGLTPVLIKSTEQALKDYTTNISSRNITKDVMKAALSNGYDANLLLRTTGINQVLRGDPEGTLQTDWKKTREAVMNFVNKPAQSTAVIQAYKTGLENEISVLEDLYATAATAYESQAEATAKTITDKKLIKLLNSPNADQLVNAFGERMVTEDGRKVVYENGEFKDDLGNQVDVENVRVMGNIYEILKEELPRLRNDVTDTNKTLENKLVLNKMAGDATETFLLNGLWKHNLSNSNSLIQFTQQNPNYIKSLIQSEYTKKQTSTEEFKGKDFDTFITEAITDKNSEAAKELPNIIEEVLETVNTLLQSSNFHNLREYLKKNNGRKAAQQAIEDLSVFEESKLAGEDSLLSSIMSYNSILSTTLQGNPKRLEVFDELFGVNSKSKRGYTRSQFYEQALASFGSQWGLNGKDLSTATEEDFKILDKKFQELSITETIENLVASLRNTFDDLTLDGLVKSTALVGKNLAEGKWAATGMKDSFKSFTADLLSNTGTLLTQAGLSVLIGSFGKNPAGWALLAAGMGASFANGMLSAEKDDETEKDETARLEAIRADLIDLLKQAREDAIYYENMARHKNAISANSALTTTKVNDAIITPSGNVISTHPDDYLIATKTPQTLLRGNNAPVIKFSIIDKSSGIKITKQTSKYNEDDNSINFEAVIENKIAEVMIGSKGDEIMAARQARQRGSYVVA